MTRSCSTVLRDVVTILAIGPRRARQERAQTALDGTHAAAILELATETARQAHESLRSLLPPGAGEAGRLLADRLRCLCPDLDDVTLATMVVTTTTVVGLADIGREPERGIALQSVLAAAVAELTSISTISCTDPARPYSK